MSMSTAEIRQAARGLLRTPTISISAIVCLALGIAATTAIASAVSRALLESLPFHDPARIMAVHRVTPHSGPLGTWPQSAPNYVDMAERSRSIESLAALTQGTALVGLSSEAVQVREVLVTDNLFEMLGARPALGRLLQPGDGAADQQRVAVVSFEFWRSRLGGDGSAVGSTLLVDGEPTTIVGVAQPDLRIPHGGQVHRADIWVPLVFSPDDLAARRSNYLWLLGRLADGATPSQADAELRLVFGGLVEEHPQLNGEGVRVAPLHAESVSNVRTPLLLLSGAVALVLLIACTNVAALLLARGVQRRRESAIRTALGATRWDSMRLSLLESLLVTGAGTVLGIALAAAGVRTIGSLAAARLPQLAGLGMNAQVLAFALVLAAVVTLVCGLVPAWRSASVDPQEVIGSNRGGGTGRAHHRALRLLAAGEIATSLILLIGAGLLLRTFSQLMQSDPGFETEHVLTLRVTAPPQKYDEDRPGVRMFLEPVLDEIRAIPGVRSAAAISALPYVSWGNNSNIRYEGTAGDDPTTLPLVEQRVVSPSFFETTGQRLIAGRLLTASDDDASPRVVLVNEALVQRDFAGEDPVGRRYHLSDTTFATIVGVVSDIRNAGPFSAAVPEMYHTYQQVAHRATGFGILVRADRADPLMIVPDVRSAIQRVDAEAAVADVAAMREVIAASLGRPRFYLTLIGAFAIVAIVLAAAGLYGIVSYSVAQRTREFGIRLALGSRPMSLMRLVTAQGVALVGAGLAAGLLGAVAATRLMGAMLFGLSPLDRVAWLSATTLLLLVGTFAVLLPAIRATRVDPIRAIQSE